VAISPEITQGPPSEREFVRALRDHALASYDISAQGVLGLTLAEIEEHSNLSRPSVTGLIRRFGRILEGQDLEGQKTDSPASARRWTIDPSVGMVIGVEIAEDHARVASSDLYGRIESSRFLGSESPDETLEEAVREIRRLLGDRPADDVVGVGVSLATPVERDNGVRPASFSTGPRTARKERWADWELVRVREQLRVRLGWDGVPVLLDNDANLNALAEYLWGAGRPPRLADRSSYKNLIYLEWSKGIGAGLILGGKLYRGEGVAGEIGHTVVNEHLTDSVCERCCHAGCLEKVAGWDVILGRLAEFAEKPRLTQTDLDEALRLASTPGAAAEEFTRAARDVGRVLGPAIHFLNPELVIIGGDVGRRGYDVIRTSLLQSLRDYTMRPALADVAIVPTKLGEDTALQGPIALVLRHARGEPLLAFLQRKSGPRVVD
jgi:predicted NBD/HSP70 family sugar kinase